MNTEHTWPQSKGATGAAKSDLHHLFPTDSKANSIRGNHPFGIVTGAVSWSDPRRCEVRQGLERKLGLRAAR